jgi:hypothetical protein
MVGITHGDWEEMWLMLKNEISLGALSLLASIIDFLERVFRI